MDTEQLTQDITFEQKQLILSIYAEYLAEHDTECHLTVSPDGDCLLLVPVPGPEEQNAQFTLSDFDDDGGMYFRMTALYRSELLPGGHTGEWILSSDDTAETVCEYVILAFADSCFDREHESLVEILPVNDENLEEFLLFLSDAALTDENVFSLGVRVIDEGIRRTAGAVSFRLTAEELIIEEPVLLPEYEGLGIETYILHYMKKQAAQADEETS